MTTQYSNIPLVESELIRVLRELTGEAGKERCGLDLVIMLDISITNFIKGVLKKSTEFVIKTLGPIDRLSVFTFSDDANMMCGLRHINEKSKEDILNLVDSIVPDDGVVVNISEALEMALQLLNARKSAEGRSVGIILMSNSEQINYMSENASQIKTGCVPVYSFSFGSSGKESLTTPHVLESIAGSSDGKTFSDVENANESSFAFSECFAGIWTVALRVLKPSRKPRVSRGEYEVKSFENSLLADDDSEDCYYNGDFKYCSYECDSEEEALSSPLTLSSQLAYERPGFTTRDDTKKQP